MTLKGQKGKNKKWPNILILFLFFLHIIKKSIIPVIVLTKDIKNDYSLFAKQTT